METTYKFLKSTHLATWFAKVSVATGELTREPRVSLLVSRPIDEASGEVAPEIYPDWFEAAQVGARESLSQVHRFLRADLMPDIYVVRIIGLDADTSLDAIQCAAAMATWKAVVLGAEEPSLKYDGKWFVDYSTPRPNCNYK